jgi:hypothetical protein
VEIEIKDESDYFGALVMLIKIGETLPVHTKSFLDLVTSLKTVKKNYITEVHQQVNDDWRKNMGDDSNE